MEEVNQSMGLQLSLVSGKKFSELSVVIKIILWKMLQSVKLSSIMSFSTMIIKLQRCTYILENDIYIIHEINVTH